MIVININSGLGNQMFHYALYLRLKYDNPSETVLMDNSIYAAAGMDNKYEIERIFGLSIPKVSDIVSESRYNDFVFASSSVVRKLPHNWLSKAAFLCSQGMCDMLSGNRKWTRYTDLVSAYEYSLSYRVKLFFKRCPVLGDLFYHIKPQEKNYNMRQFYSAIAKASNIDNTKLRNKKYLDSILKTSLSHGQAGNRYYIGNFEAGTCYFSTVSNQVRKAFVFPPMDVKNLVYVEQIEASNAVSVHLRRGDHLQSNDIFFSKNGYYFKAIRYIKEKIENPVFFLFSDDLEWCNNSMETLGLAKSDKVVYVKGNSGIDSFRDMQLMSLCKHNIIPISTFSWWASYLNDNLNKIVIAPKGYWADAGMFI